MPQISKYRAAGKAAGRYKSRLSDVASTEYAKEHEEWELGRTKSVIGQVGASVANIIGIIGERKKASEFAKYKDIAADLPGVVAEEEEYKTALGFTKTRTTYKSAISGREIPESVLSAIGYQESFAPGSSDYGDYQKVLEEGTIYSPTAAKMATESAYEAAAEDYYEETGEHIDISTPEQYEELMGMGEFSEEELPFNLTKEEEALEIDIAEQEALDVKLAKITTGVGYGDETREEIRAKAEADSLARQVSAQRDPTAEERELLKGSTDKFIKQHEETQTYEAAFIEGAVETEAGILESDEDKERKRIASLQEAALSKDTDVYKKAGVSGYLKMPGEEGAKWFPGKYLLGSIGALGMGLYKSLFKGEEMTPLEMKISEMKILVQMGMGREVSGIEAAGHRKFLAKVDKRNALAAKAAATKAANDEAAADKAASELETFTEESYLDWLNESFPNIDWRGIEKERLSGAKAEKERGTFPTLVDPDVKKESILRKEFVEGQPLGIDIDLAMKIKSQEAMKEIQPTLDAIGRATTEADLEEHLESPNEHIKFAAQKRQRELQSTAESLDIVKVQPGEKVEIRTDTDAIMASLTEDEQNLFKADLASKPEYEYVEGNAKTEGSRAWFAKVVGFFQRRGQKPVFTTALQKYNEQLEALAREAGWTGSEWEE